MYLHSPDKLCGAVHERQGTLTLSGDKVTQAHQTYCPGKMGLEVGWGYGPRVVAVCSSEAGWCPGSWDAERENGHPGHKRTNYNIRINARSLVI